MLQRLKNTISFVKTKNKIMNIEIIYLINPITIKPSVWETD